MMQHLASNRSPHSLLLSLGLRCKINCLVVFSCYSPASNIASKAKLAIVELGGPGENIFQFQNARDCVEDWWGDTPFSLYMREITGVSFLRSKTTHVK